MQREGVERDGASRCRGNGVLSAARSGKRGVAGRVTLPRYAAADCAASFMIVAKAV